MVPVVRSQERASLTGTVHAVLVVVCCLLLLGLLMVYSVSAPYAARRLGDVHTFVPLLEQAAKVAVGLLCLLCGLRLDVAVLVRRHRLWLLASFALLLLVLVPGIGAKLNGARRWLAFGPVYFQPVELARITLIVALAAWIGRAGPRLRSFRHGLVPPAAVMAGMAVLLLAQPDFGSALFLVALGALLLILGGARISHFVWIAILILPPCLGYAWTSLDHVTSRFEQFLDRDPTSQPAQSLLALGNGGLGGAGLGAGVAKLGFLPMISSDFILAAVGEELGFVGTSVVVLLFVAFLLLALRIATAQRSVVGFVLAAGITLSIAVQAVVNVAVVTAAVPTKGISLPFLSAGGSSLACTLFSVGILLQLGRDPGLDLDAAAARAPGAAAPTRSSAGAWGASHG